MPTLEKRFLTYGITEIVFEVLATFCQMVERDPLEGGEGRGEFGFSLILGFVFLIA